MTNVTVNPAPSPIPLLSPLGAALRAIGVLADTAFRVVILGTDGIGSR